MNTINIFIIYFAYLINKKIQEPEVYDIIKEKYNETYKKEMSITTLKLVYLIMCIFPIYILTTSSNLKNINKIINTICLFVFIKYVKIMINPKSNSKSVSIGIVLSIILHLLSSYENPSMVINYVYFYTLMLGLLNILTTNATTSDVINDATCSSLLFYFLK